MTAVLRQLNVLDIVLQFIHPCKVHRLQTQYIFIYHMYVIKYICHYIYRTRNEKLSLFKLRFLVGQPPW